MADGQVQRAGGSGPADASSFPRRHARTRGFTLGRPRGFQVGADGARVAFLRSAAGDDPVNRLWVLELASGAERLVADPARLLGGGPGDLPPEERARRERSRERAGGIVAFAADLDLTVASFALAGRLVVADLGGAGGARELPAGEGVLDPRVDPTGARVAWVADRALHVASLGGAGAGRWLAGEDDPEVSWGLAEFVAAEEMGRARGFWWAPDGERLAVARVDLAPVRRFHLADPANPAIEPVRLPYPAAGTANAEVSLHVVDLEGRRVEVGWDRAAYPYLASVLWEAGGPLTLLVQSRDQTATLVLAADPGTGATTTLAAQRDPAWVDLVGGVPAWLDGRLVMTADDPACDTRRLTVDGRPVTPPGLQVAEVVAVAGGGVLVAGSEEPTEVHLWRVVPGRDPERLTGRPGVHAAAAAGRVVVVTRADLDHDNTTTTVTAPGRPPLGIGSLAQAPGLAPRPRLLRAGPRELRCALLLPDRPAPGAAGGCRCCSTPTAGRTTARCWPPATASWSPSGSPTRASRSWSPTGAAPRAAARPGSGRSGATWPGRSWTTRWRPWPPWPPTIPSSTWGGSPSAAGRSAATWPPWPCCAAPTSSTPPWPAPR